MAREIKVQSQDLRRRRVSRMKLNKSVYFLLSYTNEQISIIKYTPVFCKIRIRLHKEVTHITIIVSPHIST